MPGFEIRLILYGLGLLGFGGLCAWGGYTITSRHYERVMALDEARRDQVVQTQQAKTIAALEAQQAATRAVEKQYADLKSSYDGVSTHLADSLRQYTALRRNQLSTASGTAPSADGARAESERNSALAGLVEQATAACLSDAAKLTALQTWAHP